MIRRVLAIAAAAFVLGTSLASANPAAICNPATGSTFAVTGVARNDTLNMRAGPSTTDRVVARLAHNARNIRFDGQVNFGTSACRNACFAAQIGISAADLLVQSECTGRSNLWYRVRDANGNRGWAAARFLTPAAAAPAPEPEPPVSRDTYRFRCDGGGQITLTVRPRADDAIFLDHLGQEWRLIRERGMPQPLSFRGMDNNVEMFVRGNHREVRFRNARGHENRCEQRR